MSNEGGDRRAPSVQAVPTAARPGRAGSRLRTSAVVFAYD